MGIYISLSIYLSIKLNNDQFIKSSHNAKHTTTWTWTKATPRIATCDLWLAPNTKLKGDWSTTFVRQWTMLCVLVWIEEYIYLFQCYNIAWHYHEMMRILLLDPIVNWDRYITKSSCFYFLKLVSTFIITLELLF